MFWSGNYTAVRELKFLLKEENVTLTQVLEADDILQECKADNMALMHFLTKPKILAELITLVTEEPPKNVELASQYRHASIASEVVASNISMLRDRLSMDVVQMNRLCDFVNRDPPLNPLLASYFSKTVEILLERGPKQDWYLHNIVCLRVLEFFKSRRDFLPNLLRHISTSAICDTFKCFINITDPSNKIIIEWLDEHQFLECLIQIICGTYEPDDTQTLNNVTPANEKLDSNHNSEKEESLKPEATEGEETKSEGKTVDSNGEIGAAETTTTDTTEAETREAETKAVETKEAETREAETREAETRAAETRAERIRAVAAANAAALLCEASSLGPYTSWCAGRALARRLRGEGEVRRMLQAVFTSPPSARRAALVHAARLLLALLQRDPADTDKAVVEETEEVERAIAPHLPLLHHALLHHEPESGRGAVGASRVQTAALLARLALSEVDDVPTALISLGTAGVLVDMLFSFPHNNFLHAQVVALLRNARDNRRFGDHYTAHLIEECNLLTRLMDAFEENEDLKEGGVRAGYMGHVVEALRSLAARPPPLDAALQRRWDAFRDRRLRPLLDRHDAPLGGVYPSENTYEVGADNLADTLEDSYDYNTASGSVELTTDDLVKALHSEHNMQNAESNFLELADRRFDDDMWDDTPEELCGPQHSSPWEGGGADGGAEGWAQFDSFARGDPFWPVAAESQQQHGELQRGMQQCDLSAGFEDDDKDTLTILLAQKMLTVFQNMAPDERLLPDAHDADDAHDAPDARDTPDVRDAPDACDAAASSSARDGPDAER